MKRIPRKIKHWAEEAYESLEKAIILFREEYPDSKEQEKFEIVNFATAFAAMNRGIKDDKRVKEAYNYVYKNLEEDLSLKDPEEEIHHSILFLLAYLDSHVSFGIFKEKKAENVMEYLGQNYEISVDV